MASVRLVSVCSASTVVSDTISEMASLASVRLVSDFSASQSGGGHERWGLFFSLCSLGRRGLNQALWWRAQQLRALLCPLFTWSEWAQTNTVVAGTTGDGADVSTVLLVDLGSSSHCGGGHEI
jgi:hypothetical protein